MIVDLLYYKNYRTTSVVSDAEFHRIIKKAERELTRQTSGRLSLVVIDGETATITINDTVTTLVLDDIKDCICEMAEYLYQCEQAYSSAHGGVLTSYANDGDSGSVDKSMFAETEKPAKLRSIAKSYLSGTVLMRLGVDMWQG